MVMQFGSIQIAVFCLKFIFLNHSSLLVALPRDHRPLAVFLTALGGHAALAIVEWCTTLGLVFSTNVVSELSKNMAVSNIMIKPNNSISYTRRPLLFWYLCSLVQVLPQELHSVNFIIFQSLHSMSPINVFCIICFCFNFGQT